MRQAVGKRHKLRGRRTEPPTVEVIVMKTANRTRIAIAASAALGLAAMSSSASAQLNDPQYCEELAWVMCDPAPYPWNIYAFRCWHDTYDACMGGERASIVSEPDLAARRSGLATARLG
jgi:hypothetical protein